MKSQIFKETIPNEVLFDILEKIYVHRTEKYYIINSISFKKAIFKKLIDDFINGIEPYYHASKRYYLKRKMNYIRFITIIRQICKHNEIKYESEIKYAYSKYEIHYFIYKETEDLELM